MIGRLATSLLTGSSLGATLMYLLDPDQGNKRRKTIRRSAARAYDNAADSAAGAWDSAKQSAASGWDAATARAADAADASRPVVNHLRSRLSDHLAAASHYVAPTTAAYSVDVDADDRDVDLSPTQYHTAAALARHSRDLHGEAREAYARARDLYYDALIDLDLARARHRKEKPVKLKVEAPKVKAKVKTSAGRWSLTRKKQQPDYLTLSLVAAGCCAAGALVMFMSDPVAGRRRRALVRDKTASTVRGTGQSVANTARWATVYATGHAKGAVAKTKSAVAATEDVADAKIQARVKTELGRVLSHPGALEVRVIDGSVTLSGPVLASEFDALMKCVYAVPGVREVVNRVDTHVTPANVPGLQS